MRSHRQGGVFLLLLRRDALDRPKSRDATLALTDVQIWPQTPYCRIGKSGRFQHRRVGSASTIRCTGRKTQRGTADDRDKGAPRPISIDGAAMVSGLWSASAHGHAKVQWIVRKKPRWYMYSLLPSFVSLCPGRCENLQLQQQSRRPNATCEALIGRILEEYSNLQAEGFGRSLLWALECWTHHNMDNPTTGLRKRNLQFYQRVAIGQ